MLLLVHPAAQSKFFDFLGNKNIVKITDITEYITPEKNQEVETQVLIVSRGKFNKKKSKTKTCGVCSKNHYLSEYPTLKGKIPNTEKIKKFTPNKSAISSTHPTWVAFHTSTDKKVFTINGY